MTSNPTPAPQPLTDSDRIEWLSKVLEWECMSYNGPDYLRNATKSRWGLSSGGSILTVDGNAVRLSFRDAIDRAMRDKTGDELEMTL